MGGNTPDGAKGVEQIDVGQTCGASPEKGEERCGSFFYVRDEIDGQGGSRK